MSRVYSYDMWPGYDQTVEQLLQKREQQFLFETESAIDEVLDKHAVDDSYASVLERLINAKIELMAARTLLMRVKIPKKEVAP